VLVDTLGLILGVHMAKARPDLFYAFVGTGRRRRAAKLRRRLRVAGQPERLGDQRDSRAQGGGLRPTPMAGATGSSAMVHP
jgi:hypothetical protein